MADAQGDPQPQPGELSSTAVDATLLVAALLSWHEAHENAFASLSGLFADGNDVVLPVAALLEAYAIMTRLPASHRLSPADARTLLQGSLEGACRLVDMPVARTWPLLELLAESEDGGESTGDAAILECAHSAGASRLLTLHPEAFHPRSPIPVVSPE